MKEREEEYGQVPFFFCRELLHPRTLCRALYLIARWRRYTNSIEIKFSSFQKKKNIFQGLFFENMPNLSKKRRASTWLELTGSRLYSWTITLISRQMSREKEKVYQHARQDNQILSFLLTGSRYIILGKVRWTELYHFCDRLIRSTFIALRISLYIYTNTLIRLMAYVHVYIGSRYQVIKRINIPTESILHFLL